MIHKNDNHVKLLCHVQSKPIYQSQWWNRGPWQMSKLVLIYTKTSKTYHRKPMKAKLALKMPWTLWYFNSPVTILFVQQLVQATYKAPHFWFCEWNPWVTGGFPLQRASNNLKSKGPVIIWRTFRGMMSLWKTKIKICLRHLSCTKLLSHLGIPGVTLCFCTGLYAAVARKFLSTR